jgi:hypothetical protein
MAANWSRPLPRPLTIPGIMKLATLADVRELLRHLPDGHRERLAWQHVASELDKAVSGADPLDVSVALRLAPALDGVPCGPT